MSRKRYDWFLSHLHLSDNTLAKKRGEEGYDRLFKVRPYLSHLSESFLKCYNPSEQQSIDESMIKFKGRSSLKQFMPLKPIKRGYKVWVRASSNGYVCEFEIYTGRKGNKPEKGLGARVVTDLSRCLEGKYYQIYADNFFSSFDLAN